MYYEHVESFLNLNPKRTRGTHAKEKHPFDSTERERKERKERKERESPPRRVAKKTKRTGGFTSGLFGTSHDDV